MRAAGSPSRASAGPQFAKLKGSRAGLREAGREPPAPPARRRAAQPRRSGPLEAKVAIPAVASSGLLLFVGAVLTLLQEFGAGLTAGQVGAIVGVTAALLPAVQFVVGYLAPHTARPDVPHSDAEQG